MIRGTGSPTRRLNSRATRLGSVIALRFASSPTRYVPSSVRHTTLGIAAEWSPRSTIEVWVDLEAAAAVYTVPRSTPSVYPLMVRPSASPEVEPKASTERKRSGGNPEEALQDFAVGIAREFVDEAEASGALEVGEL